MLSPEDTYQLLRQLTTPVVAITSHHQGKRNGMIIDSAIRASIVPTIPRVAIFVHKFNLSHDLIFHSGSFVLHLLRQDQFDLIHQLGFFHGTDRDKLAAIPHRLGRLGAPVLDACHAHFECRVVNAMDTGSSTCFLADVVEVGYGAADAPQGEVMTAPYFRSHLPASWGTSYQDQLAAAQAFARERSGDIRPLVWRDLGG
jgi:flavin reductase (DIM6/NTAB) family NADH-FMN oxidoreductase RutF